MKKNRLSYGAADATVEFTNLVDVLLRRGLSDVAIISALSAAERYVREHSKTL